MRNDAKAPPEGIAPSGGGVIEMSFKWCVYSDSTSRWTSLRLAYGWLLPAPV